MTTPHIAFLSGLPRSGTTLLANLANQNPLLHATPTSGLIGLVENLRNQWANLPAVRAQGVDVQRSRFYSGLEGLMLGWYKEQMRAGQVALDKNRLWPRHIEILEAALGHRAAIFYPVRDIREVLASFEKLHRKDMTFKQGPYPNTAEARAEGWLHPEKGSVGVAISVYRDAVSRGLEDRIWTIRYRDLCEDPQGMMEAVHGTLGLPPHTYNPDNVEQTTQEDDVVHGIQGLHDIRPKVEVPEKPSWPQFYTPAYAEQLNHRYADIQALVYG